VNVYGTWSCTKYVDDLQDAQGGGVRGKVKVTWVTST